MAYRRGVRDRDDPDIEYYGQGESYRPGGGGGGPPTFRGADRERAAADSWSSDRRDDRRDARREEIDSYVPPTSTRASRPRSRSPGAFRKRSRSPVNRGRDDTYSARARSPIRRFSPRREDRPRSPPRRRSRSPYGGRPRTPLDAKRAREYSPRRASPPPKRERFTSPPRNRNDGARSPPRRPYSPPPYDHGRSVPRRGSRSPPRYDDRKTARTNDNWRRRSPSPRASGPGSNNTSRRSSPPMHPDRASHAGSLPRSPAYLPPRSQYEPRNTDVVPYRARESSPVRLQSAPRTLPEDDYHENGDSRSAIHPPAGPGGSRNGNYDRAPPSGPSRGYGQASQMSPPPGPSSSMSMSAHNRTPAPSMLSAPTRPRGAPPGRFDGPPREFSGPPPPRGRGGMNFRGGPPRAASYHENNGPSPGPRGGGYGRGGFGRGDYGGYEEAAGPGFGRGRGDAPFPFRQHNNSTSTTYPRTQRFNTATNHMATNEKIVPGGKLMPSGLPPEQEKKLKMLEAEAEKMRAEIEAKQKAKREALTEWEVRERESGKEGLRSELADAHLQKLTDGEDGMGGAAF